MYLLISTTGFVISPYSYLQKTIHTNYNQTCIVRTIEQILGIPPMNVIDATALPMFDCFSNTKQNRSYQFITNKIPLDEMNKAVSQLNGKAKQFALASSQPQYDHIDGGDDNLLNRIIWFDTMNKKPYPKHMTLEIKKIMMMTNTLVSEFFLKFRVFALQIINHSEIVKVLQLIQNSMSFLRRQCRLQLLRLVAECK